MKFDEASETNLNDFFGAIRLYPENNEDISNLERFFSIFKQVEKNKTNEEYAKAEIQRVTCGSFHHVIIYKK